jgi:hypothetical protein
MAQVIVEEVVFEDEEGNTILHQRLSDLNLPPGPCEWDECPAPGAWLGCVLGSMSAANGWTVCQSHLSQWEAARA